MAVWAGDLSGVLGGGVRSAGVLCGVSSVFRKLHLIELLLFKLSYRYLFTKISL